MALNTVFQQIVSLFIIILIGFYGGKRKIIDEVFTNKLSNLLLEISTPMLIISSFSFTFTSSIKRNLIRASIYSLIIYVVTPLLVKPLFLKNDRNKRNILQFAMVFSNCGFMGYHITQSVFGSEGVIYAAIFNMFFNIFVWTYGVMLFSDKNSTTDIKKIFNNPGIIASIIGILIMVFSIKIPSVLLDTIEMVGGLTTPISMIIIGSILSRTDLKKLFNDGSLYYASFIKLIFIPGVLYLVSCLLKESSMVIKTLILMQAMPAGAMTSLFAESFNKEKEYSALVVSSTTLLSVITIPIIIKFFLC